MASSSAPGRAGYGGSHSGPVWRASENVVAAAARSVQGQAVSFQRRGKRIARKIGIFPLAQRSERVEAPKLIVHLAGVAHNKPIRGKRREKPRKQSREIGVRTVGVGA